MTQLHCWFPGPDDDQGVSRSTCMLPRDHEGPHEFTPDGDIEVTIAPADDADFIEDFVRQTSHGVGGLRFEEKQRFHAIAARIRALTAAQRPSVESVERDLRELGYATIASLFHRAANPGENLDLGSDE